MYNETKQAEWSAGIQAGMARAVPPYPQNAAGVGAVSKPTVAPAMLGALQEIIDRLSSTNGRLGRIGDCLFGEEATKESQGVNPCSAGVLGVIESKLNLIGVICDALESKTSRLEKLA